MSSKCPHCGKFTPRDRDISDSLYILMGTLGWLLGSISLLVWIS